MLSPSSLPNCAELAPLELLPKLLMKLPKFLYDSYALYKSDTSLIVKFILESTENPPKKPKVSVSELEKFAIEIKDSIKIPKIVVQILDRYLKQLHGPNILF